MTDITQAMPQKRKSAILSLVIASVIGAVIGIGIVYTMGVDVRLVPAAALLFIAVALYITSVRLYHDYLSPLGLLSIFWLGSLGIANLPLASFLHPWNNRTWLAVGVASFGFFAAYITAELRPGLKLRCVPCTNTQHSIILNQWGWQRVEHWSILIGILALAAFGGMTAMSGSVPLLSRNPNVARIVFQERYLWSIFNFGKITMFLWGLRLAYTKKTRFLETLIVIFYLFAAFGTAWRSTFFYAVLFVLFAVNTVRRLRFKFIANITILALAAFYSIGILRVPGWHLTTEFLLHPLLYIAPNFLNFGQGINATTGLSWGLYSFRSIWQIFIPSSLIGFSKPTFATGVFNVSTYMLFPFYDFGFLGVLVISAIIGWIASVLYQRVRHSPSIVNIFALAMVNISIFFMPNGFFYESSAWIYWLVLIICVSKVCRVKHLGLEESALQSSYCGKDGCGDSGNKRAARRTPGTSRSR